jgi:hypothetical protein
VELKKIEQSNLSLRSVEADVRFRDTGKVVQKKKEMYQLDSPTRLRRIGGQVGDTER